MEKLVFWDWAGTLADESELDKAVCKSIEEEIAKKENIPFSEAQKLFNDYLKKLENKWQWHDYVRIGESFGLEWQSIQKMHLDKLILLPHAKEILGYVKNKGYRNILTTNAVSRVIYLRTDHTGLSVLFDAIIASDDVRALKSEGKHFAYGLKIMKGDPLLSFSIGDNPAQDILSAKKFNLITILCDFGKKLTHYHSEHLTHNFTENVFSDFRIKNLLEIKNII